MPGAAEISSLAGHHERLRPESPTCLISNH